MAPIVRLKAVCDHGVATTVFGGIERRIRGCDRASNGNQNHRQQREPGENAKKLLEFGSTAVETDAHLRAAAPHEA
jgi:hypothetical protein